MGKIGIICMRELKERIRAKSFFAMAIIGPLLVLGIVYLLFALGGKNKAHWQVLIADPANIMEQKILVKEDASVTYDFANGYIEADDFAKGKRYQKYDALLEVNEKVLNNKIAYLFYREKPSMLMASKVQYQFERRIEELVVSTFSDMTVAKFRELKQPISLGLRNVYDPREEAADMSAWVGYFFGAIILIFIFLFGMTIMRSISAEKSNRVVELVLACVKPRQLMLGKIMGVGIAAFLQFFLWVIIVGIGLYVMRETLFPNLLDASKMDVLQLTEEVKNQTLQDKMLVAKEYNEFVELVYERIRFENMLIFFVFFFTAAYLFYGAFFAALGSITGSEGDGQQFVLPLIVLLLFALYAGHYVIQNPNAELSAWLAYIPFTSPVVCMIKLAQGYPPGQGYLLYLSFFILIASSIVVLMLAGKLYKNGILQFGHRLNVKRILIWLKN
jgi:ABC-2 type transport system permease protein